MVLLTELKHLITNDVLIVPGVAWFVAQLLKVLINGVVNKNFSVERLWGDGGMPSGHSATVSALAIMCALTSGLDSTQFAIAAVLAIIVMHDALGVRRETGKQAVSIIKISERLNEYFGEKDEAIKTDKLKVLVGHTPLQVICGALVGAVVVIIYALVFGGIIGVPI